MVFKRRDRRSIFRIVLEFVYPAGGWKRAFLYIRHRLRRLPDSPERIARGVWVGVFTTFTPFYGMHFVVAAILARIVNANLFASLMATFFGNPLTYVPIGVISLKTGHFLLGDEEELNHHRSFAGKFVDASRDFKDNFIALFTDRDADWSGLIAFYNEIFFPYLVGGLIPGAIAGTIAYYLCVPLIRAYQNRRRRALLRKFEAIKKKAKLDADAPEKPV